MLLSVSFCLGQIIDTKLDIITECPEPRRLRKYGDIHMMHMLAIIIMDEESQFGITKESCWTTKKIEINTNELWVIINIQQIGYRRLMRCF